jgi:putative Mg2+ transporter-C (MgtC) family protein
MQIVILRLIIVFVASMLFGFERQRSHKPVGFGAFIFVALGACVLGTIADSNMFDNATSLVSAVVTGIGFLGAGALIKGTDRVFGFTTASAIWLFAIFGLVIGIGLYLTGVVVYVLIWIVIICDSYLERYGIGSYQKRLSITTNEIINEKTIKAYLMAYTKRHKILSAEIDRKNNELHYVYLVQGTRESINKLVENLFKEEWLRSYKID